MQLLYGTADGAQERVITRQRPHMASIVGFFVKRSGGWEMLRAPASGDRT
jgi:hypothetical protein